MQVARTALNWTGRQTLVAQAMNNRVVTQYDVRMKPLSQKPNPALRAVLDNAFAPAKPQTR